MPVCVHTYVYVCVYVSMCMCAHGLRLPEQTRIHANTHKCTTK